VPVLWFAEVTSVSNPPAAERTPGGTEVRRLSFDELPDPLRSALAPRVERLGYLGEFFQVAAHQPEALGGFVTLTESLKESLPHDVTELVALTVSVLLGNDYERNQHEQLAVRLGLGADWVADVERLGQDGDGLTDRGQKDVQQLVLGLLATWGHDTGKDLDRVVATRGPEIAIGVVMCVGRYVAHALLANAFGFQAPVPPVLDHSVGASGE
jgi:alkylhydroperoxidase family enzyme